MSVEVATRTVAAGSDEHVEDAWNLKERIRRSEGVLKQRKRFFADAYKRATVSLLWLGATDPAATEELAGFAAVRRDGYVLFLAVAAEHRGEGFGRQLVATIAAEHDTVSCHARASNESAVAFYEHLGFEKQRSIDGYYEDGGEAYYLKLGDTGGLRDRLSKFVRGE